MMTQALITLPQTSPAPAKGADTRNDAQAVQGRAQTTGRKDDQPADSFGAVLNRQMEDKNPAAADAAAAEKSPVARKTAAGKDLKADAEAAPAGDNATLAFAAMLLAAPDNRPNAAPLPVAEGRGSEHQGNASTKIATDITATGLKAELPAAGGIANSRQVQTAEIKATDKLATDKATFALASAREELPASHPPQPGSPHTGALAAAAMQAGALQAVSPQAGQHVPSASQIASPLASSTWPNEFSQKVSWVSTQQNQSAELLLNPPDLGPIRVVLNVSDNQATALFSSPHPAVRDAIENAMPKLREVMADNGIMLGNATVSDQAPRDSGGFMNQRPGSRPDVMPSGSASTEPTVMTSPVTAVRRHVGMVDIFA